MKIFWTGTRDEEGKALEAVDRMEISCHSCVEDENGRFSSRWQEDTLSGGSVEQKVSFLSG